MDYVFVSTTLQAVFVQQLLEKGEINRGCFLVFVDSHSNRGGNKHYVESIREYASGYLRFSSSLSVIFKLPLYLCFGLLSYLCGGRFITSDLMNPIVAVTIKYMPFIRLSTYDEGGFNIRSDGPYHLALQTSIGKPRKGIRDIFLNEAAIQVIVDATCQHFTMFNSVNNVVEAQRLKLVVINWLEFLRPRDEEYLSRNLCNNVVLGTAFQHFEKGQVLYKIATQRIDEGSLYVPHPGNTMKIEHPHSFRSPAEAIILYLASRAPKITVWHFSSTASINLVHVDNVVFKNISGGK